MKKIIAVILGVSILGAQNLHAQEVVSFKDWKKGKIQEVQANIVRLESLEKNAPAQFGPEEQAQLKQTKTNLEIDQELNAQDYFTLYLSPKFLDDEVAYAKAIKMMSPEDIAQIFVAYQKLIEEHKKKSLIPIESMRFGVLAPINK